MTPPSMLTGRTLRIVTLAGFVVWLFASYAITRAVEPTSTAPVRADNVVVFAVPRLDFASIDDVTMPNLAALSTRSAIGGASVRTGGDSASLVEAFATLGAGNRIATDSTATVSGDRNEVPQSLTVQDMPVAEVERGVEDYARPGALADALQATDHRVAVVVAHPTSPGVSRLPAALAVATSAGHVADATTGDSLVSTDPGAHEGVVAAPAAVATATSQALTRADVVVVDAGDVDRAVPASRQVTTRDDPARREALQRTDAVLGALLSELDPSTLLIVVGVTPPGNTWALTPVVVTGAGVPAGGLESPSTHRRDLVTLSDIAPTALTALGVDEPTGMSGHALKYRPGTPSFADISRFDDMLVSRAATDQPMTLAFILFQSLLYFVLVGVLLLGRSSRWLTRALTFGVLTCAAWPLATFLLRLAPDLYTLGPWTLVAAWLLAAVIALAATRWRTHPLDPLLAICAATAAVIVLDLSTGAHLQYGSFFGYAPNKGMRFIGIGNAAFALLSASTITVCTALVARSKNRRDAVWVASIFAAVVVVADGAPWMGTDVGGILTTVPIFGVTLWVLSGRRVRWRTIALAGVAAASVLAVAVGLDAMREPDQRTHVSRFFLQLGDHDLVRATLARKWSANTRVLRRSLWAWLVPVTAAFSYLVLATGRSWQRVLPPRSPERTGVKATLVLALVGWLLNDSGIVVVALASMYLGPFILLLTLARPDGDLAPAAPSTDQTRPPAPVADAPEAHHRMFDSMPASPDKPPRADDATAHEPSVVALVPAKDRADSVAATVEALLGLAVVDRVLVIDDGSSDATTDSALHAGAEVLRLEHNVGKGGAIAAGVAHTPDADIYLLIDADLSSTAAAADALCAPVLADEADLVIGVLPSAGGKGGFGTVRKLAANGVRRASGLELRAPLSGQRAVRGELLRAMPTTSRFGLEVAMSIDVQRAGGRVLEVDVPMDHRHTGRQLSGFVHRGRQGWDIVRALVPRATTARARIAVLLLVTLALCGVAMVSGTRQVPVTTAPTASPKRVLIFGMQPFGFDDLDRGVTPNLQRMIDQGAIGAMSTRTVARSSNANEGYLSMGAGARLRSTGAADLVVPRDTDIGKITAAEYLEGLTGTAVHGDLAVIGAPALARRNDGPAAASTPGALGDELADAGRSGAVVNNADRPELLSTSPSISRPAGLVVMQGNGGIAQGEIDPAVLLHDDPDAPFGVTADIDAYVTATAKELAGNDLVVVDPGELERAASYGARALDDERDRIWERALAKTDAILGQVLDAAGPDTLVLVTSVQAPRGEFRLTPIVAHGPGIPKGMITSPSTQRSGLVAITDMAPTVLDALGVPVPVALPGNAVRYEAGAQHLDALRTLDTDTVVRERTYLGLTWGYIWLHAVIYGIALMVLARKPRFGGLTPLLRWSMLALASLPLGTFLVRLVPGLTRWFIEAEAIVSIAIAMLFAVFATRRRAHSLSPVAWVCGVTTAVIVVDTWTGTLMQTSSWLGYSLHNAGRFYGVPNTTFAVLGACALIWSGITVHRSQRRTEALWLVGCVLFIVLISAGAPMLGADVGTLITLTPVFALFLFVLSGRKVKVRTLVLAGVAMVLVVLAGAGLDLARPAADRSHLGQFAAKFLDEGPSALVDTFTRKQSANVRIFGGSIWSRLIPLSAIFLFVPLFWEQRAAELLPKGSVLRTTFYAVIGAALLGLASNDSGPLVVSLFVAYLPLLLAFIMFAEQEPPPRMLAANDADSDDPLVTGEREHAPAT